MLETLGHYKILDRIGAGGIGELYRARDTRVGRTVAVRLISPDIAGDRERALLEAARASVRLSHPNIATLYEVGEDEGRPYLVCEFAPGDPLKALIADRPLNPRRAIDLAIQLADALADAHAEELVHGDLKPDNIIVTPKGNAKILDFGLAEWTAGGAARSRTARAVATAVPVAGATIVRTVPYMSPEQVLGEPADYRSDIFSLGVIVFEMLTGKTPFAAPTPAALALRIAQSTAPPPSSINRTVPAELDPIVAKALSKSLDGRYESAATFAAELRSVAAILDVRSGTSEPPVNVPAPPERKSSAAVWAIVALVLAAIAGLVWLAMNAT